MVSGVLSREALEAARLWRTAKRVAVAATLVNGLIWAIIWYMVALGAGCGPAEAMFLAAAGPWTLFPYLLGFTAYYWYFGFRRAAEAVLTRAARRRGFNVDAWLRVARVAEECHNPVLDLADPRLGLEHVKHCVGEALRSGKIPDHVRRETVQLVEYLYPGTGKA